MKSLSRVRLFATPWIVDYQAPQSMEFSRQEYWGGLPLPSPEDLPNPGIEPGPPTLQADTLPSEPPLHGPWVDGYKEMFRNREPHHKHTVVVHDVFFLIFQFIRRESPDINFFFFF